MQVHSFWAINIVKHSILCGWHFSFFQQIAIEANWGKHTSAQWLNDMSRANYLSNMVADFNIARLQTPTFLLRQMNRWELCKSCCKTAAARYPWAGPEWPFTWSEVAVPQQVVSTAMEYDAGPAHTTDFNDKWRALTLQSRLQWRAKDLTLQSRPVTSEGTCLYNLDFTDEWKDLTFQSWLQWQVKRPAFTI